jgi:hypothetical protein
MLTYREYGMQRAAAKQRGIEFNLTFDEWHDWRMATGHGHERGKGAGRYVMSRLNDVGPYKLGNIKCLSHAGNIRDAYAVSCRADRAALARARKAAVLRAWHQELGTLLA